MIFGICAKNIGFPISLCVLTVDLNAGCLLACMFKCSLDFDMPIENFI